MDISIVIPLYNEVESLPELKAWIDKTLEKDYTYEIVFVDDGSNDGSWEYIKSISKNGANVKGIRFRRNYGKSAALYSGFQTAKGDVVITMDADLQDSPEEIPELYKMVAKEGFDLVSGWKKKRYDPISKRLPSKFFNRTARAFSGIKLHDFNCGLKAYKNAVVKSIDLQGEMHRYIPVLAKKNGFTKIGEKVVAHRARKYGVTKFGWERFVNGFLDLLSVKFLGSFGKKPMHFFGAVGILMFILGFLASVYVGVNKLYHLVNNIPQPLVADSPYFFIALTAMIIGVQLFLAGFIGELIIRNSSSKHEYEIEDEV